MREERTEEADWLEMGESIAELAAHIDAATRDLLAQIAAFDRAQGWFRAGALSCAHWLSWRVGMGLGAAREKVRVAHRLEELPQIDAAFARGELSYSKVRAMTRVATAENEAMLLGMARSSTAAQLEKICRRFRGAVRLQGNAAVFEETERFVRSRDTDDGMVSIQLRLLPEEAARFLSAVRQCAESGNLADGAVGMAEIALGGHAPGAPARVPPPVETVVHICAETLGGHTEDGHGISAETSRRLLCDSGVVPLVDGETGETLDIGRKTRRVPTPMRRALAARDPGCQFPGCDHTRFLDAHHIEHWLHGGETALENLLHLCRRHHRFVHEWGYTVSFESGQPLFRDPDGRPVVPQGPRPPLPEPLAALRRRNEPLGITPDTNVPGWDGQPVDYPLCLDALASMNPEAFP